MKKLIYLLSILITFPLFSVAGSASPSTSSHQVHSESSSNFLQKKKKRFKLRKKKDSKLQRILEIVGWVGLALVAVGASLVVIGLFNYSLVLAAIGLYAALFGLVGGISAFILRFMERKDHGIS
ncbi:MAG: hypothetical protein MRZ79_19425 [Bacteroidia bacterium]|nr:hypothetical protein [Bacteroidia bacterium]